MRKFIVVLLMLFTTILLGLNLFAGQDKDKKMVKHPEVDFSVSCVECHTNVTPDIVKEWKSSKHGEMNFGCYMCHGDGQQEFYPRPSSDRCISCHGDYAVDFSKTKATNCFDCHQGHTLKFHKNN